MIKQAQTYLAGARLSVALVVAALAGFLILGSVKGFSNFGVPGLGGGTSTPTLDSTSLPARDAALVLNPGGAAAAVAQPGAPGATPARGDGRGPANPADPGNGPGVGGGNDQGAGDIGTPQGGGGGSGDSGGANPGTTPAPTPPAVNSGTIKNTVDNTANTVDNTSGGALTQTGVAPVVKGATAGLAGPDSAAGSAVDNTVKSAGNLFGGGQK